MLTIIFSWICSHHRIHVFIVNSGISFPHNVNAEDRKERKALLLKTLLSAEIGLKIYALVCVRTGFRTREQLLREHYWRYECIQSFFPWVRFNTEYLLKVVTTSCQKSRRQQPSSDAHLCELSFLRLLLPTGRKAENRRRCDGAIPLPVAWNR